ncbi:helix-turn-helix domain-containing protein [Candidatus Electronema sp. PJ]|jgi:predicted site-specific integrase-resolvase|uniref:helix-turn-helix domain-containing protein n=1 Tax=Candidatus Electronema sp. PJ TaxID=3401572 RepID=UPI003AA8B341
MPRETRFTTRQAVDYLNQTGFPVSKPTLERWRSQGTGPVYLRIASRILYPQSSLDEFLNGAAVIPARLSARQ